MNRKVRLLAAVAAVCAVVLAGCAATPQASATVAPPVTTAPATATPAAATTEPAASTPAAASTAPADTTTPAATDTVAPTQPSAPQVQGLLLEVPNLVKDVTVDSNETRDDGTYHEGLIYDGMVGIDINRVKGVENTEAAVKKQIQSLSVVDVRDLKASKDETISGKLSYPAWRVTYTTGENEDTRTNVDIYIQTDDWDFCFHTATPVDAYDDYKDTIEAWFEAMVLEDAN